MKPTGIVRRVDDLGRIVIPRGLRVACGLMEDTPGEIFFDEETNSIIIKRYYPEGGLLSMVNSLNSTVNDYSYDNIEDIKYIRRLAGELKELTEIITRDNLGKDM